VEAATLLEYRIRRKLWAAEVHGGEETHRLERVPHRGQSHITLPRGAP